MSAASEEALRRWPEIDTSTGGLISQSYAERYAMRRSGFVEGALWQAEQPVTEAEIEAAAKALMSYSTNWAALKPVTQADIDRQRDLLPEYQLENWRARAKAALLAARKAVMA